MLSTRDIIVPASTHIPDEEKTREELLAELNYARSLANSNRTARIMLDEMYQFVAILDIKGNLLDVNEPALQGGGMIRSNIEGIPFWDCRWWAVNQTTIDKVRDACKRAAKGEFVRYETDIFGKSAGTELITIDFSLMPLFDDKGEVCLILPEGRNITDKRLGEIEIERKNKELRTLYEKIKELDELKSQFFANVSHELRTPLSLIVGPTEKLLRENLDENVKRDLEIVSRNARGLLKHVNNLLDISKLEAGKMNLNYSMVDLSKAINIITSCFDILAREKKLNYTVVTPPIPLMAAIDSDKIQRVVTNLLSNAFKFTPSGGSVECKLEVVELKNETNTEPGFQISVSDTGPGIPTDLHEVIFDRFRQVDGTSTRKHGGTGLGLSIVKEFVTLHKGTISVSNLPKQGCQFSIRIPLTPDMNNALYKKTVSDSIIPTIPFSNSVFNNNNSNNSLTTSPIIGSNTSSNNQNQSNNRVITYSPNLLDTSDQKDTLGGVFSIYDVAQQAAEELRDKQFYQSKEDNIHHKPIVLVVEDNVEMNNFISTLLSQYYFVVTAMDGVEGLEKTKAIMPDLIVTDCMMPRMSGDEMVKEIRTNEKFDHIPILLLTAKADENLKVKLLSNGVSDYVNKPFSSEELIARIDNLITMKKAKQFLQEELESAGTDLSELISQLASKKRDLQTLVNELEKERTLLDNANRSKDEFFMNLSHELRTPLNGILGWSQLLKYDYQSTMDTDPTLKTGLETIERCAIAQNQLINDLLDMSLIIGDKLNLSFESVNLPNLIANAIGLISFSAQSKKMTVESNIKNTAILSNIRGDPNRLQQVILNLLTNSIKFTPEGGKIVIKLATVDDVTKISGHSSNPSFNPIQPAGDTWAVLKVADNGKGISKPFLSCVFDRFKQADCSSTRSYGGLGIGLSIVQNIVHLHGGCVYANSEGENKGSQFIIVLPISQSTINTECKLLTNNTNNTVANGSEPSSTSTTPISNDDTSSNQTTTTSICKKRNFDEISTNTNNNNKVKNTTTTTTITTTNPTTTTTTTNNTNNTQQELSDDHQLNSKVLTSPKSSNILKGLHIVVVDDLDETVHLFSSMLYKLGAFKVSTFLSVSEVYDFLCNCTDLPIDIILSDLTMPNEDGYALARKIRDREMCNAHKIKKVPLIALTASVSTSDKIRVLSSGFDSHVSKPINFPDLCNSILSLVSKYKKNQSYLNYTTGDSNNNNNNNNNSNDSSKFNYLTESTTEGDYLQLDNTKLDTFINETRPKKKRA
ncbi:hypothetical protein CYY_002387 [Polysphondylium violaceum]|uniref:histidine kinase n=1 Tax=Polysphondylium violaceum TaxID=133409 RepID=A0A8J4Q7Z4_9MYCE|nr:hypothetical protein CYY_002387 [Polysphondylium violaceum]